MDLGDTSLMLGKICIYKGFCAVKLVNYQKMDYVVGRFNRIT